MTYDQARDHLRDLLQAACNTWVAMWAENPAYGRNFEELYASASEDSALFSETMLHALTAQGIRPNPIQRRNPPSQS